MKKVVLQLLAVFLIISVVFVAFIPVLKADFLRWDDHTHLYENEVVYSLSNDNTKAIFTQKVHKTYIPLTIFSFAVEYYFFKNNPFNYHLNNLLLHIFVTLLIYCLAQRLGLTIMAASISALIFGLHPVHVESVAWITERKDVLYSFFYMLSLLCYERRTAYLLTNQKEFYRKSLFVLVHVFAVLSILAKPMALSLPLVLLLIDWFKGRKINVQVFIEKIVLFAVIAGITFVTYMEHARVPLESVPQALLISSWSCLFYLRQFLLPLIMVPIVRLPLPIEFGNLEYLLSLITLVGILLIGIRLRKSKWFVFAFLYFILSIFFLIRFDAVKDTNIVADRFMYLPSLGFCLLFGYFIQSVARYFKNKKIVFTVKTVCLCLTFILLVVMAKTTYRQSHVWQNDVALWRHQLTHYPNEPIALNGLVAALRKYDDFQKAENDFRKIVQMKIEGYELDINDDYKESVRKINYLIELLNRAQVVAPHYVDIHYKLGRLYQDLGLYKNSVDMYRLAIEVDPGYKKIYLSLGEIYTNLRQDEKAYVAYQQYFTLPPVKETDYTTVISIYNDLLKFDSENVTYQSAMLGTLNKYVQHINKNKPTADSYFNLGSIYFQIGDTPQAVANLNKTLEINPRHIKALNSLGLIFIQTKQWDEALAIYQKVIDYDPRNSDAYLQIGNIHSRLGVVEKSKEFFRKAIKANPKNSSAYFNLAYTYESSGKLEEAISKYQKTLLYDPRNPEVYFNLGNVYLRLEDPHNAIGSYLKAVEYNPNHLDAWVNLAITSFNEGKQSEAKKYYNEAKLLGYEPSGELIRAFDTIP